MKLVYVSPESRREANRYRVVQLCPTLLAKVRGCNELSMAIVLLLTE